MVPSLTARNSTLVGWQLGRFCSSDSFVLRIMQRNKDGRSFRDILAEDLEKLEKFGKKAQRDVDVHVVKEGVCWTLPIPILLLIEPFSYALCPHADTNCLRCGPPAPIDGDYSFPKQGLWIKRVQHEVLRSSPVSLWLSRASSDKDCCELTITRIWNL